RDFLNYSIVIISSLSFIEMSYRMLYIEHMKIEGKTLQGIVWKEGNGYVSQCLNVNVASMGDTKVEAIKNLQEALELYFEDTDIRDVISIENPEVVPMVLHA
ncbi:MAG: hypothetical protein JWL92_420, partial [Candidatus Nomurabacteria bacterium]|nr:hypothetical protein [Candidatus Nomurabacteria bacterium]